MSTNVGAIDLDLVLNSNKFNKELNNVQKTATTAGNTISSSLKKIGIAAAAAFSVKKIIDFGKECINLGSDLAEVQNVVDVSFKTMNGQVNEFANNAIEKFGLGQTVTKKYIGTFGAMSKAFGFNEKAAYEMSTALTGLAGDVASFYNISSDEAYTKLKSVFTGETETLKDLGVVMTQSALDQYALANGYGKTTAKMSEQEKVALRYNFVLKQLQLASGDFERTQDSWANQTRVLSLRFNELKASLGQGFINLFTPIVQGINWVISKLQVLADAFKSFTEMITGKKTESSGMGQVSSELAGVTENAGEASDAVGGIGDSASKSAKKMKSLFGFDKANILQSNKQDSSAGSGTGSSSSLGDIMSSSLSETMQETNKQMDTFLNKAKELADIFKSGFSEGLGNIDFSSITKSLSSIKNSVLAIFDNNQVKTAANKWISALMLDFGKLAGSVTSVGFTIADNLLGGLSKFLEQNKKDLQNHIVKLFDISAKSHEISGNISVAVADIFSVFKGDTAKQITADLLAIFTDGFLGIFEVVQQFASDIMYMISQPFIENKDLIKTALEGIMEPISKVLGTIKQGVQDTFSKFWEVYNTYLAPAVENIKNGFSSILKTVLNVWNDNIKPILDEWAEKFDTLWKEHIQPMVDAFLEFFGKLISGISELWNTFLVPLINWIVETIVPVLAPIFETIGNMFSNVFAVISDVLGGIWEALGGLIDLIVGIFTGDWEKAWEGVKSIAQGIWDAISGVFEYVWKQITTIVEGAINTVKGIIEGILNGIKSTWDGVWNGLSNIVSNVWNGITGAISNAMNAVKNVISDILNGIKSVWDGIWNGIWGTVKGVANSILGGIEGMVNGVIRGLNNMIRAMNRLSFKVPDWVPLLGGKNFGFNIPTLGEVSLPRLYNGGYFEANQPTLAMVGDNKTQAEIVSPVPKMQDALRAVLKEQSSSTNTEIIRLLRIIIDLLKQLGFDISINLDGDELQYQIEKKNRKKDFATNGG